MAVPLSNFIVPGFLQVWRSITAQDQIAASHEFDGVRKEKERLTAASFIIVCVILQGLALFLQETMKIQLWESWNRRKLALDRC